MATQCYNKGCLKKTFDIDNNPPDSCIYHPGPPFFHDTLKIWKCCDKKFTDFGAMLDAPGCTKGPHNPIPEPVVKVTQNQEIRPEAKDEVIVWAGLNKPAERSTEEREFHILEIKPTQGLLEAVEDEKAKAKNEDSGEIAIGTECQNQPCNVLYSGPESDGTRCIYHPGVPVFHEGMKYWKCCQRKTSNFQGFMDQPGCTHGDHLWRKNESVKEIRFDWFQKSGFIHVNFYCKGTLPTDSTFTTDGLKLECTIYHAFGTKKTVLTYDLFGEIIPQQSIVNISERKIEIVLEQVNVEAWPKLEYSRS
uniref:CHORD domain-containing protein 1 n=1 Tax=Rhabditophanes sp. KR3021 TaxID=114890 RepID=A0AC35TTD0_9BILA